MKGNKWKGNVEQMKKIKSDKREFLNNNSCVFFYFFIFYFIYIYIYDRSSNLNSRTHIVKTSGIEPTSS